jgi:hypothetical protein
VISLDQVRRYTLERQGLVTRQSGTDPRVFGVLHATDHTTPYLSLLARLEPFDWEALATSIYEQGVYARLRCMRGTLHLVPAELSEVVKCLYLLGEDDPIPEFAQFQIPREDALEMRFYITEALRQHGAQSSTTIKKFLEPRLLKVYKGKWGQTTSIGPVMRWMWGLGLLNSGVGGHHWRSKDSTFALAENPPEACDPSAAAQEVARHYFAWYGPAAYEDWAWWSGLPGGQSRAAFEGIRAELVEVQVSGMPETLWIPSDQLGELEATPDAPPEMVRMLPYEDAIIKAYKTTRYRFYDEEGLAEDIAINDNGEAEPSIWLDGRIVGTWTWVKKANEPMTVEPYIQMTRAIRKRLNPEVDRIQAFIEASHVIWAI